MFLGFIRKGSLALSLLAATCSYAQTQDIPCPSISSIQQAGTKIDVAIKYSEHYYAAHTGVDVFTENKLSWSVWVLAITANSNDEVIAKGKESAQKTSQKKQEYATKLDHGVFCCAYGPGEIIAFGHPL